jgi:hypothetical protein
VSADFEVIVEPHWGHRFPNRQRAFLTGLQIVRPEPRILRFEADSTTIDEDQSVLLSWEVQGVEQVTLDQGIGLRDAVGELRYQPGFSRVVTLHAANTNASSQAEVAITVNLPKFTLDSQFRALRKPNGSFAIQRDVHIDESVGQFSHSITGLPSSLLDLGVLEITANASSSFVFSRDAHGVFGLAGNNLGVRIFDQSGGSVTSSVQGDDFRLLVDPPTQPFPIGPLRYMPDNASQIDWDVLGGAIAIDLSSGTLTAPQIPDLSIDLPGLALDSSGDFDERWDLPSFSILGIDIAANTANASNYLRVVRRNGVTRMEIHDSRDYFFGTSNLSFKVDTNGRLSGTFSGDLETPAGDFTAVSFIYLPGVDDYQFVGSQFGFTFWFGDAGSKVTTPFGVSWVCGPDDDVIECLLPE